MIFFPSRIKSNLVSIMLTSCTPIYSPYYSAVRPKNAARNDFLYWVDG